MSTTVKPGAQAPKLDVQTVGGEGWALADRDPEKFTMVVFYRGLHCPVCKTYLAELESDLAEFTDRGVDVVAVSGDSEERAGEAKQGWGLEKLPVGYGLSTDQMREWGLFVSKGIKEEEPSEFNEPGLFLIKPDRTMFFEAINSMPFGRPKLEEIRKGIDFVVENDFPPRGEA